MSRPVDLVDYYGCVMKKYVFLFLPIALITWACLLLYVPTTYYPVRVVQYQVRAAFGDKVALRALGWMYANGWHLPKDQARAVACFRKAAEKGDDESQTELGYMYLTGHGVAKDDAQAMNWYRKAADQRNARAQESIADMYERGEGVAEDEHQALYWHRLAAAEGSPLGENDLAWFYATCKDQSLRNPGAALDYAQKAVSDTEDYPVPAYVDTLAEAYYVNGQYRKAVDTETHAIALLPRSTPAGKRKEYEKSLEKYQTALKEHPESGGTER